jgi:DNA-binding SARP family transcriptional activator/ABC-type glycerol-3-phosphate transport system substrate-binding protein
MEFRILGSVDVIEDGRRLRVASGHQLALLAFFLIHANRVVSAERIIDELWGDEAPESGSKSVAFHVSKLRDALEPGRPRGKPNGVLATEPAGYVLRVAPDDIDAVRFERLVLEGRGLLADDPETARARLEDALSLWRGEPYADLADEPVVQPEIRRLQELHLHAVEDRLEADLALGRHANVIDELEALVTEHPLRERVRGQLMVAFYRAGRQAEALRTYGVGRQVLADELGIDPGPELQQLEGWILRQDPRLDPPGRRRAVRNPYKGLRPFEERDSADFFGREALVARLLERLASVARAGRLLAVVGPSGSGKSSAVRAGLVPALRAGALPGSDRWGIAVMLPGARPFRELAAALRTIAPKAPSDLDDRLERDGDLGGALAEILPGDGRALLVIDQFEELYALVEDEAERSRFVATLVEALSARDGRLLVVATLRADFLAHPLLSQGLGELIRTGTEVVTPLARDELERAIVRPAESVGVLLEPGLATEVIADVARQPGELPLLQYALTELFERSDGRRLTREGYAAVGGVLGALARRADDVYGALDADGREIARQAFLRLVVPGESGEPTARRVPRSELRELADDKRRADEAIDEFGRRRLLSFDRDAVTGEPTVQVAHEALLTRWPRLAGWIEEAREDLWTRRRLVDAATDWIHAGRDAGFLLSGSRLDLFASWAATTDLRLGAPENDLLQASLADRRRQEEAVAARTAHERALERRATTRLRALVAVLAVAALVATSLSVVVYGQGETAREQADLSYARELTAASIGNLGTNTSLSLLLAVQAAEATAGRGYVVEEAMDALHWALQASHVAYPAAVAPSAVRTGPGGARGIMLLPPEKLMALAAKAAGRGLTTQECRIYLHVDACPAAPAAGSTARTLDVYTTSGVVPVERLASASLAGTRVDAVSQLPVDLGPLTAPLEEHTGIDVGWATRSDSDLETRIAAGDFPDVAVVERQSLVAEWARAGRLVDLSGLVDVERLRSTAGDYLVQLGTVGADGAWPATSGGLYAAPLATEAGSLVWYPKAAFEKAGYKVPRTWDELKSLTAQMIVDGHTPWCLGLEAGPNSGASAADLVEELLLRSAGPEVYDRWALQPGGSTISDVKGAFDELGNLAFADGSVLGGVASAAQTPEDLAAWPMFVDPPECWLHLGDGAERVALPAGASATLAAFPFPAATPAYAGMVRGRAFTVVVFHDRPEVRQLVAYLLNETFSATATSSFLGAGMWPTGQLDPTVALDGVAAQERNLVQGALRAGTFRVAASDLMPTRVAAAVDQGMLSYLTLGRLSLSQVLTEIDGSWQQKK